jgi:hypothetical protein
MIHPLNKERRLSLCGTFALRRFSRIRLNGGGKTLGSNLAEIFSPGDSDPLAVGASSRSFIMSKALPPFPCFSVR